MWPDGAETYLSRMRSLLAVVLTMLGMMASSLLGPMAVVLLMGRESILARSLMGLGSTVVALGLVWLVRRYLYRRRPWSGLRLTWSWRAAGLGLLAGFCAIGAANGLSLLLGVATYQPLDVPPDLLVYLPVAMFAQIVLLQAFPEELWWRGHLHDVLSERHRMWTVLAVSATGFGVLHLLSNGGQTGVAEHLLYALSATGLGFLAAAARQRTGTVWAAVGVHAGFHLANGFVGTSPVVYGVQLVLMFCLSAVLGLVLVSRRHEAVADLR